MEARIDHQIGATALDVEYLRALPALVDFGQHLFAGLVDILLVDATEQLCDLSLEKLGFGVVGIASFDFFESSGSTVVITIQVLSTATCKQVANDLTLSDIFRADFVNIELIGIGDLFIQRSGYFS